MYNHNKNQIHREYDYLFNENNEADILTEQNFLLRETPVAVTKELKQYILVAGANYENLRHKLKSYCMNRMERWKRANSKKIDQRFIIFDFVGGTVETYDITFPAGTGTVSKKVDNKYTPVTAASYTTVVGDHGYGFKKGQSGVMSILDIYEAVQNIGSTSPGTLAELSFFSHGWMGGPILVNSNDSLTGTFARDPDDKDPRLFKDFTSPTTDPAKLANFKKAFHPNGYSWIWGCTFTKAYFWTLHKLIKKYGLTSLTDTKNLQLTYSVEEINLITNCATTGNCASKPVTWDTTFADVKRYICAGLNNTYASVLAKASGKNVYAALLGTYAVYENGTTVSNPLMVVEGFTTIKDFYKKYLAMELDPVGLGYGRYTSSPVC